MRKILLALMICVVFISFASADLGTYKQGQNVSVRANLNATAVNVSIYFPSNSSIAVDNLAMTNLHGDIWNYTFSGTNSFGIYVYDYCDQDGKNCKENTFSITSTGFELDTSKSIIYFAMFCLLVFFFIITIFGINQLPSMNTRDDEGKIMSISYLKYLRSALWFFEYIFVLGIMFMASNLGFAYLGESLFANIFFSVYKIMMGFTPVIVIVWFIYFFVRMYHDAQMQKILNRGMFPQGDKF
jgi:hypothetical protein